MGNKKSTFFLNKFRAYFLVSLTPFSIIVLLSSIAQPLSNGNSKICYFISSSLNKLICHQYSPRCLHVYDMTTGICARCFAFYLSFAIISAFLLSANLKKITIHNKYFYIMIFPLIVDGTSQMFQFRESNNSIRIITGILAGVAASIKAYQLRMSN